MTCDNCKKESAVVSIEQIINGKKIEQNLCYTCSLDYDIDPLAAPMMLSHIIKHMFFMNSSGIKNPFGESIEDSNIKCENCETTLSEFKRQTKLGCYNCYEAFEKEIMKVFKNIQRSTSHVGKIPQKSESSIKIVRAIKTLEKEQEEAIKHEEYEQAAILRDRIRALKKERGDEMV